MKILNYILILIVFITYSCSSESSNRSDTVPAFKSNFGFEPPIEVKIIKLKNYSIRDAFAHWMCFTYHKETFDKILDHDKPLGIVKSNTLKYKKIVKEFQNPNQPDWFENPQKGISKIYFKDQFLKHTYSDYYMWIDSTNNMVYFHVSYFD